MSSLDSLMAFVIIGCGTSFHKFPAFVMVVYSLYFLVLKSNYAFLLIFM